MPCPALSSLTRSVFESSALRDGLEANEPKLVTVGKGQVKQVAEGENAVAGCPIILRQLRGFPDDILLGLW